LIFPDAVFLYLGLLGGNRVCGGDWLLPDTLEWGMATVAVIGGYLAAFHVGGAYATHPDRMQLSDFLHLGGVLAGAGGLSVMVTFLAGSSLILPTETMIVYALIVLTGGLGYRALFHQWRERPPSVSTPSPASSISTHLSDLVPRDPIQVDRSALRSTLSDKTVLVTGAGGSIGSELCVQLLDLNPSRLVLLDVSEHNLYQLETSLRARAYDGDLEFCIADVRDETVMGGLMAREQPDLVLHTAAYKHVPLLENHPAEAFRNNTMATVHLLRLCERHDVGQFVFVSTDKAVHPTSVLGATKQRAEWYVRTASPSMQSSTVRFGNVFGSQGSVVPRFETKLAAGEPLPVTHPDMERYFMSSRDACSLLLQTILQDAYPTYILQMGEPVRIQWLAEQLIERWYPHKDPASMIEYVGQRPGEKLSEDLVQDAESVHSTEHPSILGLNAPAPYSREVLEDHFRHLQTLCDPVQGSREQLRNQLLDVRPSASRPVA
jgi:FlaA1/EpsC-like NDP-sugar epimerase